MSKRRQVRERVLQALYAQEVSGDDAADVLERIVCPPFDDDAAAVAVNQKALVLGLRPETIAALRGIYAKLPGGDCAIRRSGAVDVLDTSCPRLAEDLCKAAAELPQIYATARKPAKAAEWRQAAAEKYRCASSSR